MRVGVQDFDYGVEESVVVVERERESGTREMGVFLGRYDSLRVVGISFLPKT